jgi:predicted DNA-binding protein (MmcQ/YjbR family)
MVSIDTARKTALSLPDSDEQPHWDKTSFRVKKKIFLTISSAEQRAVIKLSLIDQSVFAKYNDQIFYPVKGAWGKKGWTAIDLKKVRKDMFTDAVSLSWQEVSGKELS